MTEDRQDAGSPTAEGLTVGAGELPAPRLSSEVTADLLRQTLAITGSCTAEVVSRSMAPTIWPGDVISLEPAAAGDVRVGDIVVADSGDALVTHRVVRILSDGFLCKGDNNVCSDEKLGWGALVGRVRQVCRRTGRGFRLNSGLVRAASQMVACLSRASDHKRPHSGSRLLRSLSIRASGLALSSLLALQRPLLQLVSRRR